MKTWLGRNDRRVKQNITKVEGAKILEKALYVNQSHEQEMGEVCVHARKEKWKTYIRWLKKLKVRLYMNLFDKACKNLIQLCFYLLLLFAFWRMTGYF